MSTLHSIGSLNQLSMTFRQYGFTDEDVIALTYFDLEKVRQIIYGLAGIKHIYDKKIIMHKIRGLRKKITGNFFTRKSHDIQIMNSLADAFERNKYSTSDVTKLKQFNNLHGLLLLVRNLAEIDLNLPLIDCISEPEFKEGWSIYGHIKIENYEFDSVNILLKKVSVSIKKSLIGKALADKLLKLVGPNANVADWLPENTKWIPKEWEKLSIVFPNTIFFKNGEYYARYIFKLGETWHSHWCILTDGIPGEYRIATF